MFLAPLKNIAFCPKVCSFIRQTRSLRPQINISKEQFQISLDVSTFNKDELRVKAVPEYVVIEGKLERKTKQGQIVRRFVRRFKLPDGCNPSTMKSELSPDGILTIKATRKIHDVSNPYETFIRITNSDPNKDQINQSNLNQSLVVPVKDSKKTNVCDDKPKK